MVYDGVKGVLFGLNAWLTRCLLGQRFGILRVGRLTGSELICFAVSTCPPATGAKEEASGALWFVASWERGCGLRLSWSLSVA